MILWCKDSYTSTEVIRHLHVSGPLSYLKYQTNTLYIAPRIHGCRYAGINVHRGGYYICEYGTTPPPPHPPPQLANLRRCVKRKKRHACEWTEYWPCSRTRFWCTRPLFSRYVSWCFLRSWRACRKLSFYIRRKFLFFLSKVWIRDPQQICSLKFCLVSLYIWRCINYIHCIMLYSDTFCFVYMGIFLTAG